MTLSGRFSVVDVQFIGFDELGNYFSDVLKLRKIV